MVGGDLCCGVVECVEVNFVEVAAEGDAIEGEKCGLDWERAGAGAVIELSHKFPEVGAEREPFVEVAH